MEYDPIKDRLGELFNRRPVFQRLFFSLLNLIFLRAWYVKRTLRELVAKAGPDRTLHVLDAGTGFGQYSYWMLSTFPNVRVTAVDIKDDYLAQAKKLFEARGLSARADFQIDDLTALKAKGPFDLILSVDVMEHIEDDRAVFRNFASVLSPGGHVLVNTPSDLGGSDIKEEGDESFIGEHVRDGYNKDELEEKLRTAGLDPIRTTYTYGTFGSLAWRLLVKYPMVMLGASWAFLVVLPIYYLLALPVGLILNAIDVRVTNARGTGLLVLSGLGGK